MAARNAARVFPEPVGATTSVSCPAVTARQAPSCARVGEPKASRNQRDVGALNRSSALDAGPFAACSRGATAPLWTVGGTLGARRRTRSPRVSHGSGSTRHDEGTADPMTEETP